MTPNEFDSLDFTGDAMEVMYDTVDDVSFRDKDAELIYRALVRKLRPIPFSDYLKRYIYRRAGLNGDYRDIPLQEYNMIVRASFSDNYTPASFDAVSCKLSALSKNWLTQHTVKRNVVFLLGFGLRMSVHDVNEFLTKALRETGINFKDPFEVICWYCYRNGYLFPKFQQLWQTYLQIPVSTVDEESICRESTIGLSCQAMAIQDEASLFSYVARLKTADNVSRLHMTARIHFDRLYGEARDLIARMYNDTEEERSDLALAELRDRLANNDRLFDVTKQKKIEQKRAERYVFTRDDITPGDIEHILCAAIPLDRHGNLLPIRQSEFKAHFHGKKFSRQHLDDILKGDTEVDRFDLITLNFFIYSQKTDTYENKKRMYRDFVDSTNEILGHCSMGSLYAANPYECFVLMCVLADDPLGTYADVWEMGYTAPLDNG